MWLTFMCAICHAQTGTLTFEEGDIGRLMERSKAQQKKLLIYYTADWCAPCKQMEQEVFADPEVISFINRYFIIAKADIEKQRGIELTKKFPHKAIPQYNIVDSRGNLSYVFSGSMPAREFISRLQESLDPESSILSKSDFRYKNGDRTTKFLFDHLSVHEQYNAGKAYDIYLELWSHVKDEELSDESIFPKMEKYLMTDDTRDYLFLQSNKDRLVQRFGKERVNALLIRPYILELDNIAISGDTVSFYKSLDRINAMDLPVEDKDLYQSEKTLLLKSNNFLGFIDLVEGVKYPKAFVNSNERKMDGATAVVLSDIKQQDMLMRAKRWVDNTALPNVQNLVVSGQIDEALGHTQHALSSYKAALKLYEKQNPNDNIGPTGIVNLISRLEEREPKK